MAKIGLQNGNFKVDSVEVINGALGLGTADPKKILHIHNKEVGNSGINITNSVTGIGEGNSGLGIEIDSSGNSYIISGENGSLIIGTNSLHNLIIKNNGYVGIGVLDPQALLDVNGGIRSGYDSDISSIFGRVKVGYSGISDFASFAHIDMSNDSYAIGQNSNGDVKINTVTGRSIDFLENNLNIIASFSNSNINLKASKTKITSDNFDVLNIYRRTPSLINYAAGLIFSTDNSVGDEIQNVKIMGGLSSITDGSEKGFFYVDVINGSSHVRNFKVFHDIVEISTGLTVVGSISENGTALSSKYLNISGNAVSATKLATARTINGVSFDGTANITITANPNSHALSSHSVSGLTTGHVLKALSATTYGFEAIDWSEITDKPSTFAPAAHDHDDKLDKLGVSITSFDNTGPNTVGITIFSSSFNKPGQPSGASYWSGFEFRHNIVEDYRSQIAMGTTGITPQLAIRNKTNGVWGSWHKVWHGGNLNPADYQPAISGTAYKVLSIQSDGSGVKTGCLRDLGNYAAIDNAERFAIIHSTDQAAISLQSQGGNRFWISSAPSVLNIGGVGTTAPENGQLQIYHNSRVVIPSLPLLVGKATATTGNPYKIEVEGNTLVNGVLALRGYTDVAIGSDNRFYRDVYHLNSKTQTTTGTMKITLPKTWSSTMLTIKIVGYNYTSVQGKWECNLGGYNYIGSPAQWVNTSAHIIGNAPFSQVRFAHDGSKCVVLLGNTGTIWNYPQIAITEVYAGYGNQTGWGTGYSISFITSETGITNIVATTVNSGVSADWNALINKPSTFTPSAHGHAWSEITGKPSTFTPSAHGHAWSEITSKPSTFAPASHALVGSAHTVSGLTTGHVMKALSATSFGFAAITPANIGAPAIGPERSLSITTAGWVTIATCATGRAYGEFHVYDSTNSKHNFTKIIASTSYGKNNVSVIGGNRYSSTRSIAHVRVLYNSSDPIYGGAKLQVYCENAPFTLYVKQFLSQEFTGWKAWNNATPVAEGTPNGWAQDNSTYLQDITNPDHSFVGNVFSGKGLLLSGGSEPTITMEGANVTTISMTPYQYGGLTIGTTNSGHSIIRNSTAQTLLINRMYGGTTYTIVGFSTFNNGSYFFGPIVGSSQAGHYFYNDSDSKTTLICGGGSYESTRGATIVLRGNEYATAPGDLELIAGATANGRIHLNGAVRYTPKVVTATSGTLPIDAAVLHLNISGNRTYRLPDGVDGQILKIKVSGTNPTSATIRNATDSVTIVILSYSDAYVDLLYLGDRWMLHD